MAAKITLQQVENAFHEMVSVPESRRHAALQSLEPEELRRQVAELLRADEGATGFLDPAISDSLPRPQDQTMPEMIGIYRVEAVLGRGGMGVVYRARDPRLDRAVAIKTLSPRVAQDPSAVERLRREAKALASINHPNIASIHGIEEDGAHFYLVLELVEGRSLAERLAAGPMRWRQALPVLIQLARALECAHDNGLVHRDVKPSNIMLDADGHMKLLDFGLAKPFGPWRRPTLRSLTAADSLVGTCSYMSPEQLKSGHDVDAASDVWAFGCVAYECLSGRMAFKGDTPVATLDLVLNDAPDLSLLPPRLPGALPRLIERCMRKNKKQRLRHIGDACLELVQLQTETNRGSGDQVSGRRRPAGSHEPGDVLRGVGFTALGLLIAASFAIAGGFLERRLSTGPSSARSGEPRVVRFALDTQYSQGDSPGFALSPEGTQMAVIQPSGLGIHLRRFDQADFRPLLPLRPVSLPFFSPDGSRLGSHQNAGVFRQELPGGLPTPWLSQKVESLGFAWGPDDTLIFSPHWSSPLMRLTPDGRKEPLTRLDEERGELSHRWPHLLPEGKGLLFVIKRLDTDSFDGTELAVADLETGTHRVLPEVGTFPAYIDTGHLLFCRHGSLVGVPFDLEQMRATGAGKVLVDQVHRSPSTGACWYSVSDSGDLAYLPPMDQETFQLLELTASGGRELLSASAFRDSVPSAVSLSADGSQMAMTVIRANTEVRLYDIERGTFLALAPGVGNTYSPLWSRTTSEVALILDNADSRSIVIMKTDGSGSYRSILSDPALIHITDWSQDGRYLLFVKHGSDKREAWMLDLEADPSDPHRVRLLGKGLGLPTLSADNRWLAYTRFEGATRDTQVRSLDGDGPRFQLTVGGGGRKSVWDKEGFSLVVLEGRERSLRRIQLAESGEGLSIVDAQTLIPSVEPGPWDFRAGRFMVLHKTEGSGPKPKIQVVLGWGEEVKRAFDS